MRSLVEQGVISALCKSLAFFKSYDKVLTKVYKYFGPTYNFEFARDVIVTLDNIVNVGEMEAETSAKGVNGKCVARVCVCECESVSSRFVSVSSMSASLLDCVCVCVCLSFSVLLFDDCVRKSA